MQSAAMAGDFTMLAGAVAVGLQLGMMPEARQHFGRACTIEPDFAECRK